MLLFILKNFELLRCWTKSVKDQLVEIRDEGAHDSSKWAEYFEMKDHQNLHVSRVIALTSPAVKNNTKNNSFPKRQFWRDWGEMRCLSAEREAHIIMQFLYHKFQDSSYFV